jgi:6-pyruvoyltetrahydropterin/6-carboxytetrahydropterin synthase
MPVQRSVKHYLPGDISSTVFRQWRADSHCNQLHGYSLGIRMVFEGEVDDKHWVVDFGSLKQIKKKFEWWFDHTTIVAHDDPKLHVFYGMAKEELIQLRVTEAVGCEYFANLCRDEVNWWLQSSPYDGRVRLVELYLYEHEKNGAYAAI